MSFLYCSWNPRRENFLGGEDWSGGKELVRINESVTENMAGNILVIYNKAVYAVLKN